MPDRPAADARAGPGGDPVTDHERHVDPLAEPVLDRARAYFEEFAAGYDLAAAESGWAPNDLLADELPPADGIRDVLDLACGTGRTLAVLCGTYPDASLTGVDIAGAMLDRAAARVPGTSLLRTDVASFVTAATGRYDLVTAVGGLEFVEDLPGTLAGLRRMIRPGGHLLLTYEPVIDDWQPQSVRVETNLGSNGLELTTVRWEPGEVTAGFDGWDLLRSRLIVAYLRDDLPTLYGWLHYRSPGG